MVKLLIIGDRLTKTLIFENIDSLSRFIRKNGPVIENVDIFICILDWFRLGKYDYSNNLEPLEVKGIFCAYDYYMGYLSETTKE